MSPDRTREELQKRMDEAARNYYARTHDPKYEAEVWRINEILAVIRRASVHG